MMKSKPYSIGAVLCLGVLLLATGQLGHAQPSWAAPAPSPSYGEELDVFIEKRMGDLKIPGMAVSIVRGGEVEYIKGYGTANPDGDLVTPETPFLLASVSKSFTALAVMQLVEGGDFELDDPVQNYLPWFTAAGRDAGEISVAHLLYHTSGFSERDGNKMNLSPAHPDGLETGMLDLTNTQLKFRPGEGWEYSNINYTLLGSLIQEVSGQRYDAYIQQNIINRLGMTDTFASPAIARAAGAAVGHYPFFGIPRVIDSSTPTVVLPAAGLWSSAADISRYLIAHLGDGSAFGLTAQGLAKLHAPGVEIEPGHNYAMGWYHAPNILDPEFLETLHTNLDPAEDLHLLWHEGDWDGFKSTALLMPAKDFGVILLMNGHDPTITSAYRYVAWDVTLIANGGDAYIFQPGETFIVRYSRWIFSGLTLLLLAGLIWSMWQRSGARPGRKTWVQAFLIVLNLSLLGYIYLKLLPDQNTDLKGLLNAAPDLAILTILISVFSVLWVSLSVFMLVKIRSRLPAHSPQPTSQPG